MSAPIAGNIERGRAALARGQWEEARRSFQAAVDEQRTPEALEGLGWALFWLDQSEDSFEAREEAYRLFVKAGEPRRAARIAVNLATDYADFGGLAVSTGWLQRARRLVEGLDEGVEHGWLALWEGHLARMIDHDLPRARSFAERALRIGTTLGDADLEMLARALDGLILVTEGSVTDGMRRLDEATAAALAGEMSDVDSVAQTCCLLVHACERVRDYDRASQWAERMTRFSRRWSTGSVLALCSVQHAAMLIGVGRWAEAEAALERAGDVLRAKRPRLVDEQQLQLAELRRRQGRWEEAESIFLRYSSYTEAALGLAALALERDQPANALDLVGTFSRRALAEKWIQRAWALEMNVDALVRLGRLDEAREVLRALRDIAEAVGIDPIKALELLAAGGLAFAEGDLATARASVQEAARLFDRASAPYEAAEARLLLAAVLARTERPSFAVQEARVAAGVFERLGATRALERARAVLAELQPTASTEKELPLSPRELEVLRLIARGMSDKETAQQLRLSEHTIHRHVANILTKLEVPSRAAAVARAARLLG